MQDLLADSNPMVVANAVAALSEIQNGNGKDVFQINSQYLFKVLRALNECTEWGQVKSARLQEGWSENEWEKRQSAYRAS